MDTTVFWLFNKTTAKIRYGVHGVQHTHPLPAAKVIGLHCNKGYSNWLGLTREASVPVLFFFFFFLNPPNHQKKKKETHFKIRNSTKVEQSLPLIMQSIVPTYKAHAEHETTRNMYRRQQRIIDRTQKSIRGKVIVRLKAVQYIQNRQ